MTGRRPVQHRIRPFMTALMLAGLLWLGPAETGYPHGPAPAENPLSGDRLYRDLVAYSEFGEHRTGTKADMLTARWIRRRLSEAGLQAELSPWSLRQFFLTRHDLKIDGRSLECFPIWYPRATGSRPVTGSLIRFKETSPGLGLQGKIAFVAFNSRNVTSRSNHERIVRAASDAGAIAVIGVPSAGLLLDLLTVNVSPPRNQTPWPIPVLSVARRHWPILTAAAERQARTEIWIEGQDIAQTEAFNVVGRIDRGKDLIVVTTPLSGWLRGAGERGPGIAYFLALAEWAARRPSPVSYLFSANAGHELGHLGQKHFFDRLMPPPSRVKCVLHLGSGGGAVWDYQYRPNGPEKRNRPGRQSLAGVPELTPILKRHFRELPQLRVQSGRYGGELKDLVDQGHRAFGIFGAHYYTHTYRDTPDLSAPKLLAPVAQALANVLEEIERTDFDRRP